MHFTWRSTRIISSFKPPIKGRVIQPTLNYQYFFWIVVTFGTK